MSSVKQAWRKTLQDRLGALTEEQMALNSLEICERILDSSEWKNSQVIGLFAGLAKEPQLRTAAERAIAAGKTVLFPKVDPTQEVLVYHTISDWAELLAGKWGILEPGPTTTVYASPGEIDLVCVPGLGFDRRGARLGRGKGYYDRFLASLSPTTIKMGVFFAMQELCEIPAMSHDVRLDGIVTEQELFLL